MYLAPEALDALEAHPWPGNIRELANVIERIVLLANGTVISRAEAERFLPVATVPSPVQASMQPMPELMARTSPHIAGAHPLVREYRAAHSHSATSCAQRCSSTAETSRARRSRWA